ncbi:GIY-YIG nuclease family protein [Pseudonocardia bannensis]|uniref:GIY-YIG nuclease family protein n=1 Tax=Pseudonocardia bannensis TaxID=630973 RepID=UPI001B7CE20C|nr:GIY-YIG nuclease family protein [Pseudonocardia bannensis]
MFLVDGTPGGLTTAEITNWTGHVVSASRSDLGKLLSRDEAQRTGVYFLLGGDELGETLCYIGESDIVGDRLKQHVAGKDFWDRVVVVTSKDANITKAHGRYLESRLIALAKKAGRVDLANDKEPEVPKLPEADVSDMDEFVAHLQIVLPVLGVNAIRVKPSPKAPVEPQESPVFRLINAKAQVDARAQQVDGEFTVLAGSAVVAVFPPVNPKHLPSTAKQHAARQAEHERLLADGSITAEGGVGRVARDIVFKSPSAAGALVQGRASCNGRTNWVSSEGQTFGAWESRGVD